MLFIYLQAIEQEEDKIKFEQLYIRYRPLMHKIAMKLLNDQGYAEDAVHQVFLYLVDNVYILRRIPLENMPAFLVTLTERRAIDIFRKNSRLLLTDMDDRTVGIDIPMPGDNDLADAIAELPAKYREAILLRYDFGYSIREIAEMFNEKYTAAQKRLYRAKVYLEEALAEEGDKQ